MKTLAVAAVLALSSAVLVRAEPNGGTVWSGKGEAAERGEDPERFEHLSAMHFANGRTVYTAMGPGKLYSFGGMTPAHHGRTYTFHVDQVHVGNATYNADGNCQVKLRGDQRSLQAFGCGVEVSGAPSLSIGFNADHTAPDFQSFDKH